jgi:hypothetical protein
LPGKVRGVAWCLRIKLMLPVDSCFPATGVMASPVQPQVQLADQGTTAQDPNLNNLIVSRVQGIEVWYRGDEKGVGSAKAVGPTGVAHPPSGACNQVF